jgi:hypothetical protein
MSVNTTPDTTWQRYTIVSFKTSKAKRFPYEELDFTIYKPNANHVAFSTTEEHLPMWIKALYLRHYKDGLYNNNMEINTRWLKQVNADDWTKCDEIVINILVNDKDNALTITVKASKGSIEAQGRFVKEWGAK